MPSTSPITQPVRQWFVALAARRLSEGGRLAAAVSVALLVQWRQFGGADVPPDPAIVAGAAVIVPYG